MERWTLCWLEETHNFCNTHSPPIYTKNNIIAITIGEDKENTGKCIELTVIFCCKILCCDPDNIIINGKITSNKCL